MTLFDAFLQNPWFAGTILVTLAVVLYSWCRIVDLMIEVYLDWKKPVDKR